MMNSNSDTHQDIQTIAEKMNDIGNINPVKISDVATQCATQDVWWSLDTFNYVSRQLYGAIYSIVHGVPQHLSDFVLIIPSEYARNFEHYTLIHKQAAISQDSCEHDGIFGYYAGIQTVVSDHSKEPALYRRMNILDQYEWSLT